MSKNKVLFFFIIFFLFTFRANSIVLETTPIKLNSPWGMSWLNSEELLITQKTGEIYKVNTKNLSQSEITHEIPSTFFGQGGLLDIVTENNVVWITCSIKKGRKYTTAVYRAELKNNKLVNEELIYEALPYFDNGKHFGSRIEILDDYLFVSIGERGKGMIAQDYTMHPGSIIRIKLNGETPNDNPRYINKNSWLPEIYQIGVRNPQGMTLSSFDNEIYITNHGAKGGDWFGKVKKAGNYGWKNLGWGGKNYIGTKIGPKWLKGYDKAINYWVPSIGISSLIIYKGNEFKKWDGLAIIAALKDQSLRSLEFNNDNIIKERIIFRNKIGRVRDIEVHPENGKILMLSDEALWEMSNTN